MNKLFLILLGVTLIASISHAQVAFQTEEQLQNQASLSVSLSGSDGNEIFTLYLFTHTDELQSRSQLDYVFNTNPEFAGYINGKFRCILVTQNDANWSNWMCKLRLKTLPSIAIFNQEGFLLGQTRGFKSAAQLQPWLKFTTGKRMQANAFQVKTKEFYPDFYKARLNNLPEPVADTNLIYSYLGRFGVSGDEVSWNLAREYPTMLQYQALRLFDNQSFLFQNYGFEFMMMQDDYATYIADTFREGNGRDFYNTIMPLLTSLGFPNLGQWERFISAHQAVYRRDWKAASQAIQAYAVDSAHHLFRYDSLAAWCGSILDYSTDKQTLVSAEKVLKENRITLTRPDCLAVLGLLQFKNQRWYEAENSLRASQKYSMLTVSREQQILSALAEIDAKKNKARKK